LSSAGGGDAAFSSAQDLPEPLPWLVTDQPAFNRSIMIITLFCSMRTASLQEIKQELAAAGKPQLIELCLRLARFKKENKELLTYLLFEAHDETGYIQSVQQLMEEGFESLNRSSMYLAKKTIRKVLRTTNRYIRYAGSRTVEVSLLIHFCQLLKKSGLPYQQYAVLKNLYTQQVKKIEAALSGLHEDIRYDYREAFDAL
jgi:hypothetical protein